MGMGLLLPFCSYNDSCPSKFLHSDESLVNVCVLGDEESPKMKGKFLWVENMRGSFGEDCRLSLTVGRSELDEMHPQYVIFLTAKKKLSAKSDKGAKAIGVLESVATTTELSASV